MNYLRRFCTDGIIIAQLPLFWWLKFVPITMSMVYIARSYSSWWGSSSRAKGIASTYTLFHVYLIWKHKFGFDTYSSCFNIIHILDSVCLFISRNSYLHYFPMNSFHKYKHSIIIFLILTTKSQIWSNTLSTRNFHKHLRKCEIRCIWLTQPFPF